MRRKRFEEYTQAKKYFSRLFCAANPLVSVKMYLGHKRPYVGKVTYTRMNVRMLIAVRRIAAKSMSL